MTPERLKEMQAIVSRSTQLMNQIESLQGGYEKGLTIGAIQIQFTPTFTIYYCDKGTTGLNRVCWAHILEDESENIRTTLLTILQMKLNTLQQELESLDVSPSLPRSDQERKDSGELVRSSDG